MNQIKMEHQQSFERSKKQINSISIFILVIAMLALLLSEQHCATRF